MTRMSISLSRVIGVLVIAAGLAALLGVVLGDEIGHALDVAALVALSAAPGVRLVALMVSWARLRDYKYAISTFALVLLILVSVVGAALWR